jgi:small subunit ribosomal protein S21
VFTAARAQHQNSHGGIVFEAAARLGEGIGVLIYVFPVAGKRRSGGTPRERGCRTVAEVKIQEGESIESALRRFKRKVQQEDIIKDIKKHSFYLKPGDKRRAKQALARKRSRKKQRRESD